LFNSVKENGEFKQELARQEAIKLTEQHERLFYEEVGACKMNFERSD